MSRDVKFYYPTPRMIALLDAVCRICLLDVNDAKDFLTGRLDEAKALTEAPACDVREIATTYQLTLFVGVPEDMEQTVRDYIATLPGDFYENVSRFDWMTYEKLFAKAA
jgi:hypothetical protein